LYGFLIGLKEIKYHKLRSFLTMLGVIFGVAAVVSMVSIGEGARLKILKQMEALGSNLIVLKYRKVKGKGATQALRLSKGLSYQDVKAIKLICSYIKNISPVKFYQDLLISSSDGEINMDVAGIDRDYMKVMKFELKAGRFICKEDVKFAKKVCVLGAEAANKLFIKGDPVGKTIEIGIYSDRLTNNRFLVIGVLKEKMSLSKETGLKFKNFNRVIYLPVTTIFERFHKSKDDKLILSKIIGQVKSSEDISKASMLIEKILLHAHKGIKDFSIIIPEEVLRKKQEAQQVFNIVMALIAAISLLIGGIGIMNIMLASVKERIHDIGIRRAIGATRINILIQFLCESVTLSGLGGIAGIIIGISFAKIIAIYTGWETVISIISIIMAFGVAVVTGAFFGFYPAYLAANLKPIDALRYE